ncbi:hypothetical protein [Streptomyces sp. NPDC059215]|uniref:hypothetical protein n=1 Tax=Streptomyces sp. NPDC059215 TaxID=3346772 RepID=UPI003680808A
MSLIIKFFAAPTHEGAAAVVVGAPDGSFESLSYGNFDVEEALIDRECIFTGRSFDDVVAADEPGVVADPDDGEGPMVLAISEALQDALATASQSRLVEVGRLWVLERMTEGEVLERAWAPASRVEAGAPLRVLISHHDDHQARVSLLRTPTGHNPTSRTTPELATTLGR